MTFVYAWVLGPGLVIALTFDPASFFHCNCPSGGLALKPSKPVFDSITTIGQYVTALFAGAVLVLLIVRFRMATVPMRRALAPLWVASILISVVFLSEAVSGVTSAGGTFDVALNVVQRVAELLLPAAFLFGLFRSRLAQSAVADLVTALAGPMPPGKLREVLARTLGDPSIQLGFWLPEAGAYVDEDGRRLGLPSLSGPLAVNEIEADGRPLAVLIHDRSLLEEPHLVEAVGSAARLALQNERLQAEIKAQLKEVRASRTRIVAAGDAERRRVERDLHDGAQQRLVTLSLALRIAQEQARGEQNGALAATLAEAAEEVRLALSELRQLARGLHPAILTEAGLGAALESLAERSPVPTTVEASAVEDLPGAVEATAYFVVSEALANVAKYAEAHKVTVRATRREGTLVVEVRDDGVGGADPAAGSGLRGLADRVAALDGRLLIDSPAGDGTGVVAEIPCA
jgi:signal transduction histidine kinase